MRSRILAIIILLILIVIPIALYLYFTRQEIASLAIHGNTGSVFTAHLSGSFWVDGLPLADRVLTYESTCTENCTLSPILPAQYLLTLTSNGKTTITDHFVVNTGNKITKSYTFYDDAIFTRTGTLLHENVNIQALLDDAKSQGVGDFTSIGVDIKGRLWVSRTLGTLTQIGILSSERFTLLRNIVTPVSSVTLDTAGSFLVIRLAWSETMLISIDLSEEKQVSLPDSSRIVSVIPGDIWKVRTDSGSVTLQDDRITTDIRFTDSIDISPEIRLGYIDKNDNQRLSLGNFPLGESVLIRLDRATGESHVVRTGMDIQFFLFYHERPAYADGAGTVFTIDIP